MAKKRKGMHPIPYDYEAAYQANIELLDEYFLAQIAKQNKKGLYACKEIYAGTQLELEIYPEFFKQEDIPEAGRKKSNKKAQDNLNDKNARKRLERLINANFFSKDIWATLVYRDGKVPKTMEEAMRNMKNYIGRINYHRRKRGLPNAKYIYVTEYDPDAEIRWHHHVIMDGAMDRDTVEGLWRLGDRNQVRRLEYDKDGLSGMANYVTKAPKGKKRWSSSQGLKKPTEKKTYNKRTAPKRYKKVGSFVQGMVRNQQSIEDTVKIWHPDYAFTKADVYFNDFNGLFYLYIRLHKNELAAEARTRKDVAQTEDSVDNGQKQHTKREKHP